MTSPPAGSRTSHGQWFKGKSLDTYTAMGPVILHKSALPFPVEADVRSYVNNEKRQDSNTRFFLTDLPQIIEDLSRGMTLEPGDIIATGTPAGVGMGFRPPLLHESRRLCHLRNSTNRHADQLYHIDYPMYSFANASGRMQLAGPEACSFHSCKK